MPGSLFEGLDWWSFLEEQTEFYESFETVLYSLGLDWHAMECLPRAGGDVTVSDAMFTFSLFCFPFVLPDVEAPIVLDGHRREQR